LQKAKAGCDLEGWAEGEAEQIAIFGVDVNPIHDDSLAFSKMIYSRSLRVYRDDMLQNEFEAKAIARMRQEEWRDQAAQDRLAQKLLKEMSSQTKRTSIFVKLMALVQRVLGRQKARVYKPGFLKKPGL
jgi:hypothetical protein